MRLLTTEEAEKKWCPFNGNARYQCCASSCMAWHEVEPRVEREDHSGANKAILENLHRRAPGAKSRREGPNGCQGVHIIEARGVCLRLHKETEQ